MTIYILWYVLTVVAWLFLKRCRIQTNTSGKERIAPQNNPVNRKIFLVISAGLLILIMGLRSQEMGVDLDGYLNSFERLGAQSWSDVLALDSFLNYEKGYVLFNRFLWVITEERQILVFVCAVLSLVPMARMIYKNSQDPLLSLIVYVATPAFTIVFSGLRQAVAMGITMWAFEFIKAKRWKIFVVFILIATLFHSSAIVVLIAYPLYHVKLDRKWAMLSIVSLPAIFVLKVPLFVILSRIFRANATMDNNSAITLFLVYSALYVFCVFYGNRNNAQTNGLTNLFWAACAIQAMGGVNSIVIRVGYYYILYLPILLPQVFEDMRQYGGNGRKYQQLIKFAAFCCFLAFGYYSLRNGGWSESYPYSFFWQDY